MCSVFKVFKDREGGGETLAKQRVQIADSKDEYFFLKGKVLKEYGNGRKYKVKIPKRGDAKVYHKSQLKFLN